MTSQNEPALDQPALTLYGSNISYFTGKMENYFRIRGIPYHLKSMQFPRMERQLKHEIGVSQMPAVQLADGRWLTDTTKMIEWFELRFADNALLPDDSCQAFVAHLIEDWADEWWWRPAMHYRWHYTEGARFASWHLATEVTGLVPLPVWLKSRLLTRRQRRGYTVGDGLHQLTSLLLKGACSDYLVNCSIFSATAPMYWVIGPRWLISA